MRWHALLWAILAMALVSSPGWAQDDYSFDFDVSAYEPKPFAMGGYLELRPANLLLDKDHLLYRLSYPDGALADARGRFLGRLQLEASYASGASQVYLRSNSDLAREFGEWEQLTTLHEAWWRWAPQDKTAVEVGKRVLKWGKGYAWNPVAFVERPKDPDEPDLPREGFFMLAWEEVEAYEGDLQALGKTVVVVPAYPAVGEDFGTERGLNLAGKVYALYKDTDLDVMFLSGPLQPDRVGVDFAKNLATNFEVHGEWAYTPHETVAQVGADGTVDSRQEAVNRAVLGVRYLTTNDITYILEYHYNEAGKRAGEVEDFYDFIDTAHGIYEDSGDATLLRQARRLNKAYFSTRPLGRRYLYLRASQKEPADLLYFTPAVTLQYNLEDESLSAIPEVIYTGYTDWELRFRLYILSGPHDSEFGEKPNRYRLEMTARKFF